MWIKNFKIKNYKSFLESQEIELRQGFNVIVGKNNVGKTALLEALSLKPGNHPHKSLKTLPNRNTRPDGQSSYFFELLLYKHDLIEIVRGANSKYLFINKSGGSDDNLDDIAGILNSDLIPIGFSITNKGIRFTKFGKYNVKINLDEFYCFELVNNSFKWINTPQKHDLQVINQLHHELSNTIYKFDAERPNIGESPISNNTILSTNANNLPQVLHQLFTNNLSRAKRFLRYVNIIFPDLKEIRTPVSESQPHSHVQIKIWTFDPDTERDDLAINIQQSGTGISQVLAILYVVITSETPKIIVIDEPQSFLHPGAIRKLFEILRTDFSQHQYIITTHSPIAITSCNPQTILLVRKEGFESKIDVIDPKKNSDMKLYLEELGASLSDVFGADKVLWVEGDTEKNCFPIIIEKLVKKPLYGVTIASVRHTGDFDKKDSHLTIEIYKRLTESNSLLPPALAFIFDKEKRSEKDIEDLVRQGKLDGKETIFFIDKMMFENYLLNPKAIHHLINSIDGFNDDKIGLEKIQNWMEIYNKENSKNGVHGAKALELLFKELSGNKIEYRKVVFGQKLTEWICENSPEDFDDFKNLLGRILGN